MNCHLCLKESDAYHEGTLSEEMKSQVKAHLEICQTCSESYRLEALVGSVIRHEKELQPDPFLRTKIMLRIENAGTPYMRSKPSYIKVLRISVIATSLAAAIFIGVIIGNIYKPSGSTKAIPVELALLNDSAIESVDVLSVE